MHLHNIMQSNVTKGAGLLAAGGLGVYLAMFVRHASRRSAHMLASGSQTQHAQQNIQSLHQLPSSSFQPSQTHAGHPQAISVPASISMMPMAGQPYLRKKYEVEWKDEWDLDGTNW